ncbi:MAG: DNA polymerase IV [Ancrocorticia sp.]|jgi:DNA polymerase-4|nr:DNA polymerase IV [Ancrocorticia sp.]MCI1932053.1 DNA polymerase IV [Ancrocorticia sp.]MCI1963414.1 DNA polymerase IV [Ancrocorticia sp.]MCI2002392.1 DNA polymerase IV [Ancrocorticia sp.]MCI2012180.1 DNA polymerase IV [Ancrocorticia sp.]
MSRAPRSAQARHSWGTDDSETPILHVDMDAFFVSVEIMDHPELKGKPVAVGGQERGVVAAASYEARSFGVNSAMPVGQAYRLCPQLVMVAPRHDRYSSVSQHIMSILGDFTPLVEQISVDEAFLDVTGARLLFGNPVAIGQRIRARIRAEAGVPASVGIAATKHVAKIASAHAKPDGLLLVPKDATLAFLHPLPVGALWGVGEKTRTRLERAGVTTVGDMVDLGQARLVRLLGQANGTRLYELGMGRDPRAVAPNRIDKSIGREETFFDHVADREELERVLLAQAHDTAKRLRAKRLTARGVSIKVRFADFTTITRSATMTRPTAVAGELYAHAKAMLEVIAIPGSGLRLLGLRAEQLVNEGSAVQLAFDDDPRRRIAEDAMDGVHARFGLAAAQPASLVKPQHE